MHFFCWSGEKWCFFAKWLMQHLHLHFVAKQTSLPFYLQQFSFLCLIYAMAKLVINCMRVKESIFKEKHLHTHTAAHAPICVCGSKSNEHWNFLAQTDLVWNSTVHRWFVWLSHWMGSLAVFGHVLLFSQINFPESNGVPWDADEFKWIKFSCSSNHKQAVKGRWREEKECEFDVPIKIAITDDRCSEKAPFLFHFFKIKQYLNKRLIDWCVCVCVIYANTQWHHKSNRKFPMRIHCFVHKTNRTYIWNLSENKISPRNVWNSVFIYSM